MTLAEIKTHCRVDADITEDDELLAFLVEAAIERAEDYTKRSLRGKTLLLTLTDFPRSCWLPHELQIFLPGSPVQEITRITYADASGNDVELSTDSYQAALDDEPPYLMPGPGRWSWPSTQCRLDAVRIEYRCGFAQTGSPPTGAGVPKKALQAVKMLVGHWYRNRESVSVETRQVPAEMPQAFEFALDPLRLW